MLTFETERALVARAAGARRAGRRRRRRGRRRGGLVTDAADPPIHLTPLTDAHRALGARLIEFSGWLMPVQYGSILEEHRTVRERVGLFDLSHMGELYVEGPEAGAALAAALVSDPPRLAIGRAHYSMICAPDGGIIDDLIVYRLAESGSSSSPTPATRRSCRTRWPSGSSGVQGGPRRPVAGDRPARGPGSARASRSSPR